MFTIAFGIWYLCAAADRHNDPVTLRETTSTLAVPPITRAPHHRERAHHRRRPPGPSPMMVRVVCRRRRPRSGPTEDPWSSATATALRRGEENKHATKTSGDAVSYRDDDRLSNGNLCRKIRIDERVCCVLLCK